LQKGLRKPLGVKDKDSSTTGCILVGREVPEDEKDEKGERLRRMEPRRSAWVKRRMVKELVLELVESTSRWRRYWQRQ
jgi:hypothetical protein